MGVSEAAVVDGVRGLEDLVEQAVSRGVSRRSAAYAAAATRRRFSDPGGAGRHRIDPYFWSVVRRMACRDPESREAAARFLIAATIEDLRDSGRSAQGVWEEIERAWSGRLPSVVLDEYRGRLIA